MLYFSNPVAYESVCIYVYYVGSDSILKFIEPDCSSGLEFGRSDVDVRTWRWEEDHGSNACGLQR